MIQNFVKKMNSLYTITNFEGYEPNSDGNVITYFSSLCTEFARKCCNGQNQMFVVYSRQVKMVTSSICMMWCACVKPNQRWNVDGIFSSGVFAVLAPHHHGIV